MEDEPEPYERLVKLLLPSGWNWKWTKAPTLEEAKRHFSEQRNWDLVVVDSQMPPSDDPKLQNGTQFMDFVRERDPNVPILPCTSNKEPFDSTRFRKQGVLNAVHKDVLADPVQRDLVWPDVLEWIQRLCAPRVESEWGRLRSVLVCRPGSALDRVDPRYPGFYLQQAMNQSPAAMEHDAFVDALRQDGIRPLVLDVPSLLWDVVRDATSDERVGIVRRLLLGDTWGRRSGDWAASMGGAAGWLNAKCDEIAGRDPAEIVDVAMAGLWTGDWVAGRPPSDAAVRANQVVWPVPNLFFMRDPLFAMGERLFGGQMLWQVRRREPSVLKVVLERHPYFAMARDKFVDEGPEDLPGAFREGGDVMALGDGVFAIAVSERTSREGVREVARVLMGQNEAVKELLQPVIPQRNELMHLDTVCSLVGKEYFLVYDIKDIPVYRWTRDRLAGKREPEPLMDDWATLLTKKYGRSQVTTTHVRTMAQAQDDGTNVFMLDQQTAVAYRGNEGFNDALRGASGGAVRIVEVEGRELSKGHGGPRCMTCPIRRD